MDEWEDIAVKRPPPKTDVQVTITESHLSKGIRGNLFQDAPALAVKEATKADWAMVGWGYARTGHPNNIVKDWTVWDKPFPKWMKQYDFFRVVVKPITFTLHLDRAIDRTPKPITRKPRRQLTFYDEERRRERKSS